MALYGSDYDFSVTGGDLIEEAMVDLKLHDPAADISGYDMMSSLKKLNMIVKQLMGPNNLLLPGFKVWKEDDKDITFASNKNKYAIQESSGDVDMDDVPVEIKALIRRDSDDNDSLLTPFTTYEEYAAIGAKSVQATPTKYYYEKKLDAGYLYFNTKIDDLTDTYVMKYLAPIKDVTQTGTLNLAQHYYRVLLYMLEVDLMPRSKISAESAKIIIGLKNEAVAIAQTFEPENVNVFFQPDKDD